MWKSEHKSGLVNLIHTITTPTPLSVVAAFTVYKICGGAIGQAWYLGFIWRVIMLSLVQNLSMHDDHMNGKMHTKYVDSPSHNEGTIRR